MNFDDPSCAVVVIGLALRCAPGQTNKQNGDAIGRARWKSSFLGHPGAKFSRGKQKSLTVTGHIPEGLTAFDGVTAGMDQINHISYIVRMMAPEIPGRGPEANRPEALKALRNFDPDSEPSRKAIEFLKSHGTVVDPTLAVFEMFERTGRKPLATFEPGAIKVAPALATQLRNVGPGLAGADLGEARFAASLKAVAALHRAGVPIVVGTDQTVSGHSVHREMELYVEAGFTPMEALQAATMVPARVMGVEKETGTLEPGKRADLVILGANPLENISNIRRTETVIQGGAIYDCEDLSYHVIVLVIQ